MLKIAIIVGLIVYSLFFILQSYLLVTYPFPVAYGEGIVLNQADLLAQGKSIYQDIHIYPYIVSNYPPLFPFLNSIFIKLFGISFIPGRLITFLATLFSALLIYIISKKSNQAEDKNRPGAFLAAGLFIASPYIYNYFPIARVDVLAFLFSLAGLYFIYRFENSRIVFSAVIFFILALYTKQSFIAAPAAAVVYLLSKDYKKALIFVCLLIGLYLIIFFFINHFTHGQFFLHNYIYNINTFSLHQLIKMYIRTLQIHSIIIGLTFFWIIYRPKQNHLFIYYFILSGIVALSAGKVGSNYNYFCEFIGAGAIIIGSVLNKLEKEKFIIYSLLLIQLIIFFHIPYLTGYTRKRLSQRQMRILSDVIKHSPEPILSEDAGLLVLNNKEVLFQPFIFTQLSNQRIWKQNDFLQDIRERKFSKIILTFDLNKTIDRTRLTEAMAEMIKDNYILQQRIGDYYIYRPINRVEKNL